MNTAVTPLAFDLGAPEIVVLLLVLILLFGGRKLPELARGTGRALRIFKAETQGLMDDDDDKPAISERRNSSDAPSQSPKPETQRQSDDSDS